MVFHPLGVPLVICKPTPPQYHRLCSQIGKVLWCLCSVIGGAAARQGKVRQMEFPRAAELSQTDKERKKERKASFALSLLPLLFTLRAHTLHRVSESYRVSYVPWWMYQVLSGGGGGGGKWWQPPVTVQYSNKLKDQYFWVVFYFGCSAFALFLLGLIRDGLNGQSSSARWVENAKQS